MKAEFLNQTKLEEFSKNHPDEMVVGFEFKFHFDVNKFGAKKISRGSLINKCIDQIEKMEVIDDYDDMDLTIKYIPDFDEINISILINELLR